MKKEVSIWMNGVTLILSIVAICLSAYTINFHPISFREPDLNWILGLLVSFMAIAVTVMLGVQIHTVMTIDKRFQSKIEEEREKYKLENVELEKRLKSFTIAIQKFTAGNIYLSNEEYNDAFCVFCLAAIDANKLGENDLVSNCLEQAVSLLNHKSCINKCEVVMKYISEIEKGMISIPDKRAIYIYNHLSSLPSFD